jgi:hypothetical protein
MSGRKGSRKVLLPSGARRESLQKNFQSKERKETERAFPSLNGKIDTIWLHEEGKLSPRSDPDE